MADTNTYSYDNKAIKEDLLNIISNLSPRENKLLYGLGTSPCTGVIHEWLNDTLATAGANSAVEGASLEGAATTNPTRDQNYNQIFTKTVSVSESDRAANAAGFGDRYAYEMNKKMKEFANDQEFAIMRGTIACGSGSAARTLKGIKAFASTLTTTPSGVSLSESTFLDYLDNAWTNGSTLSEVYVGSVLKRRINGWTAGSTKNIDSEDKRLVNVVDIYESDNGIVKIFRHRYVTVASTDTNYDIVMINPELIKTSYLRKPKHIELAKISDATRGAIVGEMTLEVRHQLAVSTGLKHL